MIVAAQNRGVALVSARYGRPKWSACAPSKLNESPVPTTVFTVTLICAVPPQYNAAARGAHATVVADVHAVLPHTSAVAREAVAVGLEAPKLSPLIVTVSPPVGTAFATTVLTTGAA